MNKYADIMDLPRPKSAHPKMSLENRANQFMPMDALRGFSVAVLAAQRERQLVGRITLSEDALELLDRKIHQLEVGESVTVTHFRLEKIIGDLEIGSYATDAGPVVDIDMENGALGIPNACISFADIYQLERGADELYDGTE